MSGIEERYASDLVGSLACLDRVIVYGTWQGLCHTGAVAGELRRLNLGMFDLKVFAQPLSDAVRQRATELASEAGSKVEFFSDWGARKFWTTQPTNQRQ